jgi:hypothetical protein
MRVLLLLTLSALFLAPALPADADKKTDKAARKAFKQGVKFFEAGQFDEAVESFREAYELQPAWKLLYNIGQGEAAAKRHGLALESFAQYLSEGGDALTPKRREEVLSEVKRLRDMAGSLEIEAPDGAEVHVDGKPRGTTPLPGRIRVSAGVDHEVVLILGDDILLSKVVRVGGGESQLVTTTPEAPTVAPVPGIPPPAGKQDDGPSPVATTGWVVAGVGAAVLVAGGVTGGVALSKNKDIEDNCPGGDCEPAYHDDVDSRDALATTSTVLIGVGAAAVVAGVLMLTVFDSDEDPSAEVALLPVLGPETAGAALEWRF